MSHPLRLLWKYRWYLLLAAMAGCAALNAHPQITAGSDASSEVNGLKAQLADVRAAHDVEIAGLKAQIAASVVVGPITAPVSAAVDAAAIKVTTEQTNKAVEHLTAETASIRQRVDNGIPAWQFMLYLSSASILAGLQTTISKIIDRKFPPPVKN